MYVSTYTLIFIFFISGPTEASAVVAALLSGQDVMLHDPLFADEPPPPLIPVPTDTEATGTPTVYLDLDVDNPAIAVDGEYISRVRAAGAKAKGNSTLIHFFFQINSSERSRMMI